MRVRNREGKKQGKGRRVRQSRGQSRSSAPARGCGHAVPSSPSCMQEPSRLEAAFPSPPPPSSSRRAQIPHPRRHRSGRFPFYGEVSRVPTALRCSGAGSRTPNPPSGGHRVAAVLRVPLLGVPAHPEPNPEGSSTSSPPTHTPRPCGDAWGRGWLPGGAGTPTSPPLLLLRPARCHGSS